MKIIHPLILIREAIKEIGFEPGNDRLPKKAIKRFIHFIDDIPDLRLERNITYRLKDIILISFLAVLSGSKTWMDISEFADAKISYIRRFIHDYTQAPSHDTFARVFGLIDPIKFGQAMAAFLVENVSCLKKAAKIDKDEECSQIAVDGKQANGTGRKNGVNGVIHNLETLNIYDVSNGITLLSVPIDDKTNEIPMAQKYLNEMDLKKRIITFDALNTQKETVRVIYERGGDYVGGLKGNHEIFHKEVSEYFDEDTLKSIKAKNKSYYVSSEKAHNNIEKREYFLSTDINWFEDKDKWSGLKSFICCITTKESLSTKKKSIETRYYITSLKDVELCADAIRGHWQVEILHWHLDNNFMEDDNSTMDKNAFNNLSTLNKMCLTLYKLLQPCFRGKSIRTLRTRFMYESEQMFSNLLSLLDEDILEDMFSDKNK